MKKLFRIKITENGMTNTLPANMTKEDAEWEMKMQMRLQRLTNGDKIKVEITEE